MSPGMHRPRDPPLTRQADDRQALRHRPLLGSDGLDRLVLRGSSARRWCCLPVHPWRDRHLWTGMGPLS